jgi:hypothetical protein
MFTFLSFLYVVFAGGLWLFHSFLIMANLTTRELMQRGKADYLRGVKGNPFSRGVVGNVLCAVRVPEGGQYMMGNVVSGRSTSRKWKPVNRVGGSNCSTISIMSAVDLIVRVQL